MTLIQCEYCGTEQDITVTRDTYFAECEACSSQFDIPREHRKNKADLREYTSRTNIRIAYKQAGDELVVAWTVQSADKGNQYLEKDTAVVDASGLPVKLHWYVAIFKALQRMNEYKEARIWVKHQTVIDHLSGEANIPETDLRHSMREKIVSVASEKFYGVEFCVATTKGRDLKGLLRRQAAAQLSKCEDPSN